MRRGTALVVVDHAELVRRREDYPNQSRQAREIRAHITAMAAS